MISVNTINRYVFSRPQIITPLTIPGRSFDSFDDDGCPVTPVNEQPETDAPYVVFSWKTNTLNPQWWRKQDDITYFIWDYDVSRQQTLENELMSLLGRMDDTAEAINMWKNDASIKILTVNYLGSTHHYTQEQEGGVVGKMLNFRVEYVDCTTQGYLT